MGVVLGVASFIRVWRLNICGFIVPEAVLENLEPMT